MKKTLITLASLALVGAGVFKFVKAVQTELALIEDGANIEGISLENTEIKTPYFDSYERTGDKRHYEIRFSNILERLFPKK